jgi:hypothetical protein
MVLVMVAEDKLSDYCKSGMCSTCKCDWCKCTCHSKMPLTENVFKALSDTCDWAHLGGCCNPDNSGEGMDGDCTMGKCPLIER